MLFNAADFLFIPAYGFAFAFLMTLTVRALCGKETWWSALNLLPLGIGLFDCIENLCILGMLFLYPESNPVLGTLAGGATSGKWLLTLTTLSILIVAGILLLARRLGFRPCPVYRQR